MKTIQIQTLYLTHRRLGFFANMGLTREIYPDNPLSLSDLLDTVRHIGWHDSNRNYYIDHRDTNKTNLIFATISGGGILELDGVCYSIRPETITLIPSNVNTVYYTAPNETHWEFYWMHVHGINITNILHSLYRNHIYTVPVNDICRCTAIFEDILTTELVGLPLALFNAQKITELLHLLLEESFSRGFILSDNNAFVKSVVQYIEKHYSEYIDLTDIAASVYMSRENLIRTFRRYTGYTPYNYLKLYRIMRACELLSGTSLSVKEIANRVGYRSSSNFTSEFRSVKNMTPIQYRKK